MFQVFMIPLHALQPSHSWVCADQLKEAVQLWQQSSLNWLNPVLVSPLEGGLVLVEGHAQALAAYILGISRIRASWNSDQRHWEAHRAAMLRCQKDGIYSIADLNKRVIERTAWLAQQR